MIVDEADVEFDKLQDDSLENEWLLNFNIPKFEEKKKEDRTPTTNTVQTIISDIELDIKNIDGLQKKRNVIV